MQKRFVGSNGRVNRRQLGRGLSFLPLVAVAVGAVSAVAGCGSGNGTAPTNPPIGQTPIVSPSVPFVPIIPTPVPSATPSPGASATPAPTPTPVPTPVASANPPVANASLSSAQGVAIDPSTGNLYVAAFNGSLQKYDVNGNLLGVLGTSGAGQLTQAVGVGVDSNGNVYVGDYGARNIKKFDKSGNYVATLTGASGRFNFGAITGIAVDASDNVYVADDDHSVIYVFNSAGTIINHFGAGPSGLSGEPGTVGIALDHNGNLWVAQYYGQVISKFTASGKFIANYGTPDPFPDQPVKPGVFKTPYGIGIDAYNNVYVADLTNNVVQEFDTNGNFKALYGTGVAGSGADQLNQPAGVAITNTGTVYVSDAGNKRLNTFKATP